MEDLLQQGITAYKAGKRDEARRMLASFVKQNPDSERAWGWMSSICNTDQERIHCLKQVMRINPKNEKARQMLEQLLAPPFASDLPLAAVSSVPPSLPSSGVKSRSSGLTQPQLFVLLGLAAMVVFICGFALLYVFVDTGNAVISASPTSFVAPSGDITALPSQVQPTATLIPTYAYAPTWTPLPSPTSFVVATLVPPSSKPQQAQGGNLANPPSVSSGADCSSQLNYAAAMHQYYIDVIDYIHAPLISLYQSWIDEAVRNRDALGVVQAERKLDNEKAQVKAEKAAENKRYKAEKANINASCQ